MKNGLILLVLASFTLAGCSGDSDKKGPRSEKTTSPSSSSDTSSTSTGDQKSASTETGTTIPLTPDNTVIEFVGTHKGDKPDPRTGRFDKFTGELRMNDKGDAPRSITLQIDATALSTDIDKLTNHLKSEDFFDVNQHPKVTFRSTNIENGDNGHQVVGDLTLHGVTKEISFPATVETTDGKPGLKSEFTIDRTNFDMNYGLDSVEEEVIIKVTVYGDGKKE